MVVSGGRGGWRFAPPASGRPLRQSIELDCSQSRVVDLDDSASAAVLGAPGSGKTATLVEVVADRVLGRGWSPDEVLALTTSRATATRLRDAIAIRLATPTTGPMARTIPSLAFEIVRDAARAAGQEPPRLVTGGELDADIAALLEGHRIDGGGPQWPVELDADVRQLRAFRTELRDVMMRATEYEISSARLRELGREQQRSEWNAAADFIDEYLAVTSFTRSSQLDPAELLRFAVAAVASDDPGERVARLRLVLVDDLQESTEATLALLAALSARGIAVIAFGDPDVAANAFRGGEPDALGRLGAILALPQLETITLSTAHRQGETLRAFTASITGRIGAAAAGTQRAASAGRHDDPSDGGSAISTIRAATPARQWATVARVLREQHLERGIGWGDLAVVVRSGASIPTVERALARAEVPVRRLTGATALRDQAAARELLTIVDVGIGRAELTPERATGLLLGPFGGLDRLGLRRLRLALRAEEIAGGGVRSGDELLVDVLAAPGRAVTIDHRVGRAAERMATTLETIRASDGTIDELLWIAWDSSGVARGWREQALGGGVTAAEANRDLDAVVALFTAAKRFVERQPDGAPAAFLAGVLDVDVPEDTLSPQPTDDAVLVSTPAGVLGMEFDTVVVAGLQDGGWPNLRVRGTALGAQELVRAVSGIRSATLDERLQVLGDELRLLALSVSRARRNVVLAAVANDDDSPSRFFDLAPAGSPVIGSAHVSALSLRAITGELRRSLVAGRAADGAADAAASSLAALAAVGVPGADPAQWQGLLPVSSTAELFEGMPVPVSPSNIESIDRSPLDWFLDRVAASDSGAAAGVGTIIHSAMETATDPSVEGLWEVVERRWSELTFEAPWVATQRKALARRLIEALADYLAQFERDGKSVVGAEKRFRLAVGRASMGGAIDRVERAADGSVVIVDLKTGMVLPKAQIETHPQLGAYQLAYAEGLFDDALAPFGEHRSGGAKLLFVKEGIGGRPYREGIQPPLDANELQAFRERVAQIAETIAAAEFDGLIELPGFGFSDGPRYALHRVKAVSSD